MESSDNNYLISAVVCTFNRASYVKKAIESLLDQTLSRELYEIIVIDNASVDETASVVKEYENRDVRYFYESEQGLSFSKNTGFRKSRSDIVAYLDDDAVACREWLEKILGAFSLDEEIAAAGGRIIPVWEAPKPPWITPNLYTYFSCIDWSDKPYFLKKGGYLFGGNVAYKKQLLIDCGGFPTNLGRVGNILLSNEEWEVFKYIDQSGLKKYYDPDIYIEHTVLRSRINWKWLRSRLYWQGVSNLYHDYFVENYTRSMLFKKYLKEMTSFFSQELSKLIQGKGDTVLLRLFAARYTGTVIHFIRICLGLSKRG
jgi:glycosyltransferase involved in cell wall biosynthesis